MRYIGFNSISSKVFLVLLPKKKTLSNFRFQIASDIFWQFRFGNIAIFCIQLVPIDANATSLIRILKKWNVLKTFLDNWTLGVSPCMWYFYFLSICIIQYNYLKSYVKPLYIVMSMCNVIFVLLFKNTLISITAHCSSKQHSSFHFQFQKNATTF